MLNSAKTEANEVMKRTRSAPSEQEQDSSTEEEMRAARAAQRISEMLGLLGPEALPAAEAPATAPGVPATPAAARTSPCATLPASEADLAALASALVPALAPVLASALANALGQPSVEH